MMVQLYIDDGVANRGHRTTQLSSELKLTGMAYCDAEAPFGKMIVVAYAGSFTPSAFGVSEAKRRSKN